MAGSSRGSAEFESLADKLNKKYLKNRASTEIPQKIKQLKKINSNDTGPSSIGRANRVRWVKRLYSELAEACHDINSIEITEQDLEVLFVGTDKDNSATVFSEKYEISRDAALLYYKRLEKEQELG